MSTQMDYAANEVMRHADECRFRETDEMCPTCGRDLEVYYCENRTFAVRCEHCETITLVKSNNPYKAAEKVGAKIKFVRHGLWVKSTLPTYGGWRCTVCNKATVLYKPNYCPDCGAKMDVEET